MSYYHEYGVETFEVLSNIFLGAVYGSHRAHMSRGLTMIEKEGLLEEAVGRYFCFVTGRSTFREGSTSRLRKGRDP